MSDQLRWRYGDANPVVAAVDSETVIEIGDLLWQDVDDAKPASGMPLEDLEDEDGDQYSFAQRFLGVAMQRSRPRDNTPIRVATTGVFEFDCPSGTFELGDLVGLGGDKCGGVYDQEVAKATSPADAIARVARREPHLGTTVLVAIRSTVMTGGILPR